MPPKKKAGPRPNPYQGNADIEDLSPPNRAAVEILTERPDLLPSVDRIMAADLSEDDTVQVLGLFHASLSQPGDPHRDPRAAIATVTGSTPA